MAGGLDSLLNGMDPVSLATGSGSGAQPITAYEKHGLRVVFTFPNPPAPGRGALDVGFHHISIVDIKQWTLGIWGREAEKKIIFF